MSDPLLASSSHERSNQLVGACEPAVVEDIQASHVIGEGRQQALAHCATDASGRTGDKNRSRWFGHGVASGKANPRSATLRKAYATHAACAVELKSATQRHVPLEVLSAA